MAATLSPPSPTASKVSSSPPSSPGRINLRMADVANIFVKMRRTKARSKAHHIESNSGEPQTDPSLAAEGVTCAQKVDIELEDVFTCVGGVDVKKLLRASRTRLFETATYLKANVLVDEQYVDPLHLLLLQFLTRTYRWKCTICGPKHRRDGSFKVHVSLDTSLPSDSVSHLSVPSQIVYTASASRATLPDPQRPPALEKAKSVPGLMTIRSRRE